MFGFINSVDKVIGHRKVIRVLTFETLTLRQSESISSEEGLTFETPALESFYGGQITLSTLLSKHLLVQRRNQDGLCVWTKYKL